MSEKMLVTQALDERDLLVKKIADKIAKASFVDTIKPNEEKVYAKRISKEDYAKEAEAAYQQIMDLIDRFQKIDAAIVASNAKTQVTTSYGTFTVAGAISLRSRLRGLGAYEDEADFEGNLQNKLRMEYNERVRFCDTKNSQLQATAEDMRLSILGRDSKTKDDKPLGVVEAYVKENTTELVDPLDVKKKLEALEEKRSTLLTELDTQIKVSNATTFIEVAQDICLHYENLKFNFPVTGLCYKNKKIPISEIGMLNFKSGVVVAHMARNHEVVGSNPTFRKSWVKILYYNERPI